MLFAGRIRPSPLLQLLYILFTISRDEVDVRSFSSYVLVDHHVSNFDSQKIAMVFDHRPRDANAVFRPSCSIHMADVGSCATLITNYILQESANSTDDEKGVLKLLYGEAHLGFPSTVNNS